MPMPGQKGYEPTIADHVKVPIPKGKAVHIETFCKC